MGLNEPLLTTKEVAEQVGKSEATVNHWRVTGEGPPFIKVGRTPLYRPSAVEKWLDSRTVTFTRQTFAVTPPPTRRAAADGDFPPDRRVGPRRRSVQGKARQR